MFDSSRPHLDPCASGFPGADDRDRRAREPGLAVRLLRSLGRGAAAVARAAEVPMPWDGVATPSAPVPRPSGRLTPATRPPDVHRGLAHVVYPGRRRAVVPFSVEMLGTELMAAYPWSREHGWSANN
jgi:hypothetical protein